jgi:hypothetical protein
MKIAQDTLCKVLEKLHWKEASRNRLKDKTWWPFKCLYDVAIDFSVPTAAVGINKLFPSKCSHIYREQQDG